jgi:hypothetical protein
VVALLIVIVILAAPLAYKAFENRLFRNVEWKFFGS